MGHFPRKIGTNLGLESLENRLVPSGYSPDIQLPGWSSSAELIPSEIVAFDSRKDVTSMYHTILSRDPDPVGLNGFALALERTGTPAEISRAIWNSPESRQRMVGEYYRLYLDRVAEPEGEAAWVRAFQSGLGQDGAKIGFLTSREYLARAGQGEDLVRDLYLKILERPALETGLIAHTQALGRFGVRSVVVAILTSPESLNLQVSRYYTHFLDRFIEPNNKIFGWLAQQQNGAFLDELGWSIAASRESLSLWVGGTNTGLPYLDNRTITASAEQSAQIVEQQARIATLVSKSYGVGGMIVENSTGRVIHAFGNRASGALANGTDFFPTDPSNHGETQLVKWYYGNTDAIRKSLGYLPSPSKLTVVTSLDPCAMCAGSLITAGFNVAVVAPDDSGGGVNWDSDFSFTHVSPLVRKLLLEEFGYYQVTGVDLRSVYQGGNGVVFADQSIGKLSYDMNAQAFNDSAETVSQVRKQRIKAVDVKNPVTLLENSPEILALKALFPEALSLQLTERYIDPEFAGSDRRYFKPNAELYEKLKVAANPSGGNAVAMIDVYGNLLGIRADLPGINPIATALMNLVGDYSRFVFDQISQASVQWVDFKASPAYQHFPTANVNSFIFLKAPSAGFTTTLKDLGLFGSSADELLCFIEPPNSGSIQDFKDMVKGLPIYYRGSEEITPRQMVIEDLVIPVTSLVESGEGTLRQAIERANATGHYTRIEFRVGGTLRPSNDLPAISVPITLDATALKGPFGDPGLEINFDGHQGLHFAAGSSGSQVFGIAFTGSSGYALEIEAPGVMAHGNRFGVRLDGTANPNILGSIRTHESVGALYPAEVISGDLFNGSTPAQRKFLSCSCPACLGLGRNDLESWNSPTLSLRGSLQPDATMEFSGTSNLISVTRLDTLSETVDFSFINGMDETIEVPNSFSPSPRVEEALTSQIFQAALASLGTDQGWKDAEGKSQGSSTLLSLAAGTWKPQVKLAATGTVITQSWLTQVGNSVYAEFLVHPKQGYSKDSGLASSLGKTFQFAITLATPGANTRTQSNELSFRVGKNDDMVFGFGFYNVTDGQTGAVTDSQGQIFLPGEVGYLEVAYQNSLSQGAFFQGDALPALGTVKELTTPNLDPGKSFGVLLLGQNGLADAVSTYSTPAPGTIYPFQSFLLDNGVLGIGIESNPLGGDRDFNDLIFSLPDNLRIGLK